MTHLFVRRAHPARRQGLPQAQSCLLKALRSSCQATQLCGVCACRAEAGRQSCIGQAQAVTPGRATCKCKLAAERKMMANDRRAMPSPGQAELPRQTRPSHAYNRAQDATAPGNRRACHRSSTPAVRATSLPQA